MKVFDVFFDPQGEGRTELLVEGQWQSVEFSRLVKGSRFRMFFSNGKPVHDVSRETAFVAQTDPYEVQYQDGTIGLMIEAAPELAFHASA